MEMSEDWSVSAVVRARETSTIVEKAFIRSSVAFTTYMHGTNLGLKRMKLKMIVISN